MRLIPAIDIMQGQCVRLSKGDFSTKKVYNSNPLEVAKSFEENGIKNLHLVDLDGAKSKHIVNYKILESICTKTNLNVDFGGGLKSDNDLKTAFESGARQVSVGSVALRQPEIFEKWLQNYGSDKIILGADCKDRKVATLGWMETSEIDVISFIKKFEQKGISYVICTDINKDGMLEGTSNNLYKKIVDETTVKLIASGGVSNIDDLVKLKALGCEGVIIGKAIYEEKITLKQLQELC
ncbi:MAG: 1-(5-phosphoribosyl)-5-[(5-phosphoribosylamino)methylideneamino]imidazole-4-carboxamide isomerase [Flavobacteriaceae bacterium]|nr:1-(5-phosphoribosyl)-5-[(5-phosphoribosylamino)methylideneamino]imidazole-4-carboxamide isomerase [Flavobacteriaceae bacterium]